jgi:predicted nucleic acid-binding protein
MIFIDAWAWFALAYKKVPCHSVVVRQHRIFHRQNRGYITSNEVMSEFITSLFRAVPFDKARLCVHNLLQLCRLGRYQLIFATPDQFDRAWDLRQRFHDKSDISFVDPTSMVVMQDLDIARILSGDAHILQVGMRFQPRP